MQTSRIGMWMTAIALSGATAAFVATAQTRPEPQGPGADRARRLPVTLHPHDIESTFIRMPLAAGQEKYGGIEGNRLKQFVREITAISVKSRDAGDLMWGRIAGTRYDDNISARRWWVHGSDKLAALVLDAYKTFGVTVYEDMDTTTTGDMSHIDRDAPSIQLIESPLFYHTDRDTPDYVPAPGLEAVARAYAKVIDDVNTLDRQALMPRALASPSGSAAR